MDKTTKLSITSNDRVGSLIEEAQKELEEIAPQIDELERALFRLAELKERKDKLEAFILNLKSILSKDNVTNINAISDVIMHKKTVHESLKNNVNKVSVDTLSGRKVFIPDVALSNAKLYLRQKNNINFEIYKAIVFNTGEASTEEIKYYLIKNNIKQTKTGKGFEDVPLKEISSRTNYLVRKNLLISTNPGIYSTVFGWEEV